MEEEEYYKYSILNPHSSDELMIPSHDKHRIRTTSNTPKVSQSKLQRFPPSRTVLLVDISKKSQAYISNIWSDKDYDLEVVTSQLTIFESYQQMAFQKNKSYRVIFVIFTHHLFDETMALLESIRQFEEKYCIKAAYVCAIGKFSPRFTQCLADKEYKEQPSPKFKASYKDDPTLEVAQEVGASFLTMIFSLMHQWNWKSKSVHKSKMI